MAERTGQQLGNYRLIRLLGRGGFAEVYLGEHVRLNSYAAVKVLNTQLMGIEAESFQREGLTIARLVHPHIIRVFDYDLADGTPFLIMDYAPNGTLRSRHAKGVRVPLAEIVFYVRQVASALQYAHSEKVIHRDIKPENMLLGRNNEILLSDFGIATMSQSSRYQNTVDIVGTVAYMAPEQIQGKPHPASDQYSLGIVVYEWLSGVRPFQGSFTEIAVQHAVTPPPPLREKVPDIPPDVEQVLQIALAKHVHQRFASVQAFANAFEQASQTASPPVIVSIYEPPAAPGGSATVAASPVPAASPTPQSPALPTIPASSTAPQRGRRLSRRTVLAGVAGLVVVVASGGIGWLLRVPSRSRGASPPSTATIPQNTPATNAPVQNTPTATTEPVVTGSWSQLPALLSPEADNAAAYIRLQQHDYIYINGGYRGKNNTPAHDDGLYRYDTGNGQWTAVTSSFPGMFDNAIAVDEQNRLFFTAGYSPDTGAIPSLLYMYQPDTGAMQTITPPSQVSIGYGGSMLADQQGHLYLTQGFLQVFGSHAPAGNGWYRYDIAVDRWETLAPLPASVAYAVLAADGQGGIVLLGGATNTEQTQGTTAIYRYDISFNSWTLEQAAAPQAFNGSASCSSGNGKVVVVGGYDPDQQIALNNTWLIDLNTLQSTALPPIPQGGSRLGAAACDGNGNVYVLRGVINDPDQPTTDFWKLSLSM